MYMIMIWNNWMSRGIALYSRAVAHDHETDAGGVRLQTRDDQFADRCGGHAKAQTRGRFLLWWLYQYRLYIYCLAQVAGYLQEKFRNVDHLNSPLCDATAAAADGSNKQIWNRQQQQQQQQIRLQILMEINGQD